MPAVDFQPFLYLLPIVSVVLTNILLYLAPKSKGYFYIIQLSAITAFSSSFAFFLNNIVGHTILLSGLSTIAATILFDLEKERYSIRLLILLSLYSLLVEVLAGPPLAYDYGLAYILSSAGYIGLLTIVLTLSLEEVSGGEWYIYTGFAFIALIMASDIMVAVTKYEYSGFLMHTLLLSTLVSYLTFVLSINLGYRTIKYPSALISILAIITTLAFHASNISGQLYGGNQGYVLLIYYILAPGYILVKEHIEITSIRRSLDEYIGDSVKTGLWILLLLGGILWIEGWFSGFSPSTYAFDQASFWRSSYPYIGVIFPLCTGLLMKMGRRALGLALLYVSVFITASLFIESMVISTFISLIVSIALLLIIVPRSMKYKIFILLIGLSLVFAASQVEFHHYKESLALPIDSGKYVEGEMGIKANASISSLYADKALGYVKVDLTIRLFYLNESSMTLEGSFVKTALEPTVESFQRILLIMPHIMSINMRPDIPFIAAMEGYRLCLQIPTMGEENCSDILSGDVLIQIDIYENLPVILLLLVTPILLPPFTFLVSYARKRSS